jgi:heme oxygenase
MTIQTMINPFTTSLFCQTGCIKVKETRKGENINVKKHAILPPRHDERALNEAKQAGLIRKFLEDKYILKPLSKTLDEALLDLHVLWGSHPFLNELVKGEFRGENYLQYLCCLYVIHLAIEKAQKVIKMRYDNEVCIFEELYRSEKILQDFDAWATVTVCIQFEEDLLDMKKDLKSCAKKPAKEMAHHIMELSKDDPLLLIGTLYTLYGCLLADGQIIKEGVKNNYLARIAGSGLKAFEGQGVSLYTYPFDIKRFKEKWHQSLDGLLARTHAKEDASFLELLKKEACFTLMKELEFIKEIEVDEQATFFVPDSPTSLSYGCSDRALHPQPGTSSS